MVTADANQWDETICNMMACQHPPCWETMWRIENGHPRVQLRTLDSPESQSPEYEEELPTLKIVDLPLNYSQKERIKRNGSFASISKSISSIREARPCLSNSTLNETLILPASVHSSVKNQFPGLNSRLESHASHVSPISFNSWKQFYKVQVMDLGEFAEHRLEYPPASGSFIFRWIPHMRRRQRQPEKSTPRVGTPLQRKGVKEIALENILSCNNSAKAKMKKSNKVPTGGQPFLFHLKKTQKVPASKSSPGRRETHVSGRSVRKRQFSACHLHLSPVTSLSGDEVRDLEERKGWRESKEKGVPSLMVQKAPSVYQFGAKVPTNEKGSWRTPSRTQFPFGGVGLTRHPMPALAEPLNRVAALSGERVGLPGKGQNLLPEAFAEDCSPQRTPAALPRKKKSVTFVDYKSNIPNMYIAGCDHFVPRLVRTESKPNHPHGRHHLGSRKEAASLAPRLPPSLGRELWLPKETALEAAAEEGGGVQSLPPLRSPFGHPPPPPPSPLVSEFGELPAVVLTGPSFNVSISGGVLQSS